MPSKPATSKFIVSCEQGERALQCRLQQSEDRWQTTVELFELSGDSDDPIELMRSIEGDPQNDWPPSPPFQECQQLPSMPNAILATGMAGNSHWSVAVEPNDADHPTGIQWDVACRIRKEQPALLGSTFRVSEQFHVQARHEGDEVILEDRNHDLKFALRLCNVSATEPATTEPAFKCQFDPAERHIAFLLPQSGPLQLPQTLRWKYELRFA